MTIEDTFYTLVPINWLLRCTALTNIHRKGIEVQTFGSMIKTGVYVFVFTSVNLFSLYQKLNKSQNNIHDGIVKFSYVIQMTYWFSYFVYIIDLYFVQKYSGNFSLKYIKIFDAMDKDLGRTDYNGIRRTIVICMVWSIGAFFFISLFDYVTWTYIEGWQESSIYSIDYLYWFLNILTILNLVSHIIQVEYRLKIITGLLQDKNSLNFIGTITNTNEIGPSEDNAPQNPLKKLRINEDLGTTTFTKCYLQLLEQVNFVNTSYGFQIVVHCVNMLFNMVNLLNLAIRPIENIGLVVMSPFPSKLYRFLAFLSSLLRAFNYELMAIVLMYRCEQAYRQEDKILETIDVLLADTKHPCQKKTNLLEFRNLLITRPIKFHAAKFFTIDYPLLVSLNSLVVTYTIIMRQNIK